ncbi:MAG: hypothetical protein AAGJ52_04825 [Pseudomonadota bacterium]
MLNKASSHRANRRRQWFWIGMAILILLTGLLLTWEVEDPVRVTESTAAQQAPLVTVVAVSAAETTASVSAYGGVRSRWNTEVRSAVAGRVVERSVIVLWPVNE